MTDSQVLRPIIPRDDPDPAAYIAPHRSWEQLKADNISVDFNSDHTDRLVWYLDGDFDGEFPATISVSPVPRRETNLAPFFSHADGGGKWHEIAELPLTKPPVSSIDVSSEELEEVEYSWAYTHRDMCDCDEQAGQVYVCQSDLPDGPQPIPTGGEESEAEEGGGETKFLMRCCGEDRPVGRAGLKVTVTPSPGKEFVTIRDYLATVQPWLRSHYDDLMLAKRNDPDYKVAAETIWWMVMCGP